MTGKKDKPPIENDKEMDYAAAYKREKKAHLALKDLLEVKTRELMLVNQCLTEQNLAFQKSEREIKNTVTKLETTQAELKKLAHHDSLTDLPNRRQFEEDLKREIARALRYNRKLALLYLDLDFFKKINDTYGHDVGDLLLKEVAIRLRSLVRAEDFIARLGGDEFAIILTEVNNLHDVGRVGKRIVNLLSMPFQINGHSLTIGSSIGIACYPEAGTEAGVLHKNADIALYSAKGLGRNCYQFYTSSLEKVYSLHLEIEAELHFALERQEFFLVYQPRFDLQTEKMVGMETLLRWNHPTQGVVHPSEFIAVAEETGLIVPIGEWIFSTACKQFAVWRQQNPKLDCVLDINISPRQIQHKNFISSVTKTIKKYNIPAELLQFEINETAVVSFLEKIETALIELRNLGINFSIDDFGSGYSSLTRLKELPIQSIKIDRSFVNDIDIKVNDNLIIRSTIELAKDLGLNVVASGVETESQMRFLVKNHCPEAQGYYYSKPLTSDQMTLFIQGIEISTD